MVLISLTNTTATTILLGALWRENLSKRAAPGPGHAQGKQRFPLGSEKKMISPLTAMGMGVDIPAWLTEQAGTVFDGECPIGKISPKMPIQNFETIYKVRSIHTLLLKYDFGVAGGLDFWHFCQQLLAQFMGISTVHGMGNKGGSIQELDFTMGWVSRQARSMMDRRAFRRPPCSFA